MRLHRIRPRRLPEDRRSALLASFGGLLLAVAIARYFIAPSSLWPTAACALLASALLGLAALKRGMPLFAD